MNDTKSMHAKLHDAFLEDHQHLTRGLSNMRAAILSNEIGQAKSIAETMNSKVGPHIEFEERVFYPYLETILGESEVAKLYAEHHDGMVALRAIMELDSAEILSEMHQQDLVSAIDAALEHAFSCGTLLSHLDNVDDSKIAEFVSQHEYYRNRPTPWIAMAERVAN